MEGVELSMLYDEPFVAVFPSLVRRLEGDVAAAAVLQHIHFRSRTKQGVEDENGDLWYPVSREELADEIGLSFKQVKRIIDKLRTSGLLETMQLGGTDRRNFYRIWVDASAPNGTDRTDPNGIHGRSPNGVDVPPYIRTLEEEKQERRVRKPVDDSDTDFNIFWDIYPRKEAKGHAKRAWVTAIRKCDPSVIIEGAVRYRDDPNREKAFTAMPATWLNGERWSDEALPQRQMGSDRKMNEVEGMIRRAAERDAQRLEIGP